MTLSRADSAHEAHETHRDPAVEASGGRYAFLARRAVEFVQSRGGAVSQADLIAYVFGAGSAASLWESLLRHVLEADGTLVLRHDGYWALPDLLNGGEDAPNCLVEFVALDVETTGLKPLQQRVIEIAAIRYRNGKEIERFETLVFPERRIPGYITKLTGITDELVAAAPRFAEIASELEAFLGTSLIVGHKVGFDLSFLNAEFARCGRPALINERLDVMALAMKLTPSVRRPTLDRVATSLGLQPRQIHRAAIDATLAAQAALRLAELARQAGHTTLDRLKAVAGGALRQPAEGVGRARAMLDRSLIATIPRKPGVYLMRDAHGHILYIGKAKNLRERVSSYYSQPLGYTRKLDGLIESVQRIDVEVTGSELEALLLESQLIKRYQPRYNTVMRSYEQYPFIRVDVSNPWPRLTLAKSWNDDGARYFGPFRNTSAARAAVEVINEHFPLRTCRRSFRDARSYGSPCLRLDLGKCPGPCVGRANRDTYMAIVRQVIRVLDGDDSALLEQLWQSLEEAARQLDFERARRLRNDLRSVEAIVSAQRSQRAAAERHTLVLVLPSVEPGSVETLLVVRGRLWSQIRAVRAEGSQMLAQRFVRSWERYQQAGLPPLDHTSVDESNILNRWLAHNWGHPAILPITSEQPDWSELAARALALSDDALTAEVRSLEDGELDSPSPESLPESTAPKENDGMEAVMPIGLGNSDAWEGL